MTGSALYRKVAEDIKAAIAAGTYPANTKLPSESELAERYSVSRGTIRQAFAALRDGSELASLEAAARSRSEADWIVGMNATRAATIRLRSSFDGAVSLGRVQTPTLAILARREQ